MPENQSFDRFRVYLRNFHKNFHGIQRGFILYDFWNFAVYLKCTQNSNLQALWAINYGGN